MPSASGEGQRYGFVQRWPRVPQGHVGDGLPVVLVRLQAVEEEAFAQFPDDGMVALDAIRAGGLCRRLFSIRTTWPDRLGQQLGNVSQDGLGLLDDLLHHIVDFGHVIDALGHFASRHHRLFPVAFEGSFD